MMLQDLLEWADLFYISIAHIFRVLYRWKDIRTVLEQCRRNDTTLRYPTICFLVPGQVLLHCLLSQVRKTVPV